MSLTVNVWGPGDSRPGGREVLDAMPGESDLAGFESCRTRLWGAPVVRSLGALFLPRLADGDVWVECDEVTAFGRECVLLRDACARIASATGYRADFIAFRLTAMVHAARRAERVGGGVVIW